MQTTSPLLHLIARQVVNNATTTANTPSTSAKPTCGGGGLEPHAQFNMGLHIGALFIILTTSTFGKSMIMRLELTDISRSILSRSVKTSIFL
jgi:hypothetical protein